MKGETRIKVQVGKTINIGNYESIRIDYGLERTLLFSEGEFIREKMEKATAFLDTLVAEYEEKKRG